MPGLLQIASLLLVVYPRVDQGPLHRQRQRADSKTFLTSSHCELLIPELAMQVGTGW